MQGKVFHFSAAAATEQKQKNDPAAIKAAAAATLVALVKVVKAEHVAKHYKTSSCEYTDYSLSAYFTLRKC